MPTKKNMRLKKKIWVGVRENKTVKFEKKPKKKKKKQRFAIINRLMCFVKKQGF